MTEVRIAAEARSEFGKGASRRLRRESKVPAVIYGHGADPVHVALPAHDLARALKNSNVLLELELEGATQLVLPKSVQRDPVRRTVDHVDLVTVISGEKVVVEVPVLLEGKIVPGGLLDQINHTLAIEAEATNLPESVSVSIEGLDVGDSVYAKDVVLPEGATLDADPELMVAHVIAAPTALVEEVEEAEVAGEVPAVEAEVSTEE